MKKLVLAALAATAFAGTAGAQAIPGPNPASDGNADVTLTGTIALSCTVSPEERAVTVDLNSTAEQSGGSLTYKCNGSNGFTRKIESLNGGKLVNPAGGFVPYTVGHGGGSGLAIGTPVSLSSAYSNNLSSSAAFVNGQTGSLKIFAAKPGSATDANPLYAGNYGDVIQVSVTAN